jgi:UTP--glucose-1-phosphate uridylyltransferase
MATRIRKVIIPATGLGTRFLPATKVVPKELLPIAGKPLIQFAVEEAVASGLDTIILVVNQGKNLIAEHFFHNNYLEDALHHLGCHEEAALIEKLSELAEIHTVWQETPLNLADTIRSARAMVGDEVFAVILPDVLIDGPVPCILQLVSCYQKHAGCIVGVQTRIPGEEGRFGTLDVLPIPGPCCANHTMRVAAFAERRRPGAASPAQQIVGRYLLEPEIFACVDHLTPGVQGELRFGDALSLFSQKASLYAHQIEGHCYDTGSKFGFLRASLAYALKDPELAGPLHDYLAGLTEDVPA